MAKTDLHIKYRAGYRYQLADSYRITTTIFGYDFTSDYVYLMADGELAIRAGYAWDGATRAIDTPSIMRASLVHDALYQLARIHNLSAWYRCLADQELYEVCRADGMSWLRAQYVLLAVRWFGAASADPRNKRKVRVSP